MTRRKRGYSRSFRARAGTGKNYLLDNVPAALWSAAKVHARRNGLSMRGAILHLLTLYVDGAVSIPRPGDAITGTRS